MNPDAFTDTERYLYDLIQYQAKRIDKIQVRQKRIDTLEQHRINKMMGPE